jgi:hypothetical protein
MAVFLPAASKWVRTREDARRYIESSASEIVVLWPTLEGEPKRLSELPPDVRATFIDVFMVRYDRSGWLPYTVADEEQAQKAAAAAGLPLKVAVDTGKP